MYIWHVYTQVKMRVWKVRYFPCKLAACRCALMVYRITVPHTSYYSVRSVTCTFQFKNVNYRLICVD